MYEFRIRYVISYFILREFIQKYSNNFLFFFKFEIKNKLKIVKFVFQLFFDILDNLQFDHRTFDMFHDHIEIPYF